jgi:hypothetical protein
MSTDRPHKQTGKDLTNVRREKQIIDYTYYDK